VRTSDELLLSLDCGTQSVRALLFDLAGNLVGREQEPLKDYRRPQPGWLEHDGEGFWQATARCCQALWAQDRSWRDRVRGVAVTTQRASVIPVDHEGHCLYPAIIWLDQRRASQLPDIKPWWRLAIALAGQSYTVRHFQREAEVNWLAQHEPALHGAAHKFLLVSGLLNHRLTGRFVDSIGSLVAYLPFDSRHQQWAKPADWKWQALAARPEQLPELLPVGSELGEVSAAASESTGIPAGTPVIAAAADKACEILGSGVLTPNVGALSYGTTATINITTPSYVEVTPGMPPYPASTAARCRSSAATGWSTGSRNSSGIPSASRRRDSASRRRRCSTKWSAPFRRARWD
jgi:sugar (pentulose or hexulose) kinase